MQYSQLIRKHLEATGERPESFAKRAGVSRATVFRVLANKETVSLDSVLLLLQAAGYRLVIMRMDTTCEPLAVSSISQRADSSEEANHAPQA